LKTATSAQAGGPASAAESASWMPARASMGAITLFAKPSSYARPWTFRPARRMESPLRQDVQWPQPPPNQPTPPRCPTRRAIVWSRPE
jgi:hypothetical protein